MESEEYINNGFKKNNVQISYLFTDFFLAILSVAEELLTFSNITEELPISPFIYVETLLFAYIYVLGLL